MGVRLRIGRDHAASFPKPHETQPGIVSRCQAIECDARPLKCSRVKVNPKAGVDEIICKFSERDHSVLMAWAGSTAVVSATPSIAPHASERSTIRKRGQCKRPFLVVAFVGRIMSEVRHTPFERRPFDESDRLRIQRHRNHESPSTRHRLL